MATTARRSEVSVDATALQRELSLRGWSQADPAAKADLSPTTVNAIMHDKAVSLRVVRKIARALDAEPVTATMTALLAGDAT